MRLRRTHVARNGGTVPCGAGAEVGPCMGAASPNIRVTRSSTSTPYCDASTALGSAFLRVRIRGLHARAAQQEVMYGRALSAVCRVGCARQDGRGVRTDHCRGDRSLRTAHHRDTDLRPARAAGLADGTAGDRVITTTLDASGVDAQGRQAAQGPNPQTGPFYVEGAEPDDLLVVTYEKIETNRATA